MKSEIIKTVLHLTDDKGWTKERELEGDWCGYMWIERKYARGPAMMIPLERHMMEPPCESVRMQELEFESIRIAYEKIAGHYYLKRVYLEQKA